jgi:hypothetical protein
LLRQQHSQLEITSSERRQPPTGLARHLEGDNTVTGLALNPEEGTSGMGDLD